MLHNDYLLGGDFKKGNLARLSVPYKEYPENAVHTALVSKAKIQISDYK